MNVLILTPDRVGSTLLQRVLTVYMLRQGFDKSVINLHELTNGLIKYYNETLNQEVLGKPRGTDWGYHQSLNEIEDLLKSTDHYKTSRLAHYHLVARNDSIAEQIKFYNYLNENFFIISCRRENLFEHVLSWGIKGHSKKLNVYNSEEKINAFFDIYKNKITISQETLVLHLNKYRSYINWADTHFNIQSHWNYDTDVKDIEKYILNLDFMQHNENNTWENMFGQDFDTWNACHRLLPNLVLVDRPNTTSQIRVPMISTTHKKWDELKGPDWPQTLSECIKNTKALTPFIQNEIEQFCHTISTTKEEYSFLAKHIDTYMDTNSQLMDLVDRGFLVTNIPLKLQSLKEKKLIIKNFDQCIEWYNQWVEKNNFGTIYSESELDSIMSIEDQRLNSPIDQQILLQ